MKKQSKKKGQSLVEYALILALVSTVCFFVLQSLGLQVKLILNRVAVTLNQVNQQQQVIVPEPTPTPEPTPEPIPPCNNGNGHGHGYGRCR